MNSDYKRIIKLLTRHSLSLLTEEESRELNEWVGDNAKRRELLKHFYGSGDLADSYRKRSLINSERAMKEMENRLGIKKRRFSPISLAAVVIAVIVVGIVWLLPISQEDNTLTVDNREKPILLSTDSLTPGESLAYIIDGDRKVKLEQQHSSKGTPIGDLKMKGESTSPIVLEVPRGGEFVVVLEDSTKVWLNSSSTITYPENFVTNQRKVKITGEAYFKVKKNTEESPFYVECDGQTIKVYGTEFNVRSYPEEESVYTSLAKGSIAITPTDQHTGELLLTPGTQAVFNKINKTASTKSVNIETVTGWRHGRFVFENQTLSQIMNDLSRWYDFTFEFGDPSLREVVFMGSIPRYADFSTAMTILEKTGDLTFKVQDNKIIVNKR